MSAYTKTQLSAHHKTDGNLLTMFGHQACLNVYPLLGLVENDQSRFNGDFECHDKKVGPAGPTISSTL